MTIENINPTKTYFFSVFTGIVLNMCLLILVCTSLQFDTKSALCVYAFGEFGFLVKAFLFFLPYFLFYNQERLYNQTQRRLLIWTPLMLFFIWFVFIIVFQIDFLIPDISYGYIMRFPHFFIQLISVLIICSWTAIKFYRNKDIFEQLQTEENDIN
jgi:hypothetical protein